MVVECVIGEVANFGLFFKKYLKETELSKK